MEVICCNVNENKDCNCFECYHSQPHEPIQVRDYKDNCSVVLKYCPDGKENIKNVCRCVEIKDIK